MRLGCTQHYIATCVVAFILEEKGMKEKNKTEYNLCFKYSLCKNCPRNKKCTEELKKEKSIPSKRREKIHIDLSNFFKT